MRLPAVITLTINLNLSDLLRLHSNLVKLYIAS